MNLPRSTELFKRSAACGAARFDGLATPPTQLGLLDDLQMRMPSSCSKCGCTFALISSEKNRRSLRCASCRTHLGWISDAADRFLHKIVERFGRPAKPIEIHHNRHMELSPPSSGAEADANQLSSRRRKKEGN
jgi:hypothetical protein